MAQPVQGGVRDAGGVAELGEAVAQDLGAQPMLVGRVGTEQPRAERLSGACRPLLAQVVPELGGGGPDREGAAVPGLGRGQLTR